MGKSNFVSHRWLKGTMKTKVTVIALMTAYLLTACGGGGDGSHSPSEAATRAIPGTPPVSAQAHPFPVAAVFASRAVEPVGTPVRYEYSATGTDGSNYFLIVIRETKADVTFSGNPATPTVITENLLKNGVSVYYSSRFEYVEPGTNKALGSSGNAIQAYSVIRVENSILLPFPVTAQVGDLGSLPYGAVSIETVTGREGHFWEVKADTDSTALLCEIIEASAEVSGEDVYRTYPRTYCYRVDTSDQVIGRTISLTYEGEILLLRRSTPG